MRGPINLRRQAAFTLTELLAAVVIAGLLLGIGVPSYSSIIQRQKTSAAVAELGKLSLRIAKQSRDDVIFARDGNFIGPAEKF
jgi:prepilin-type N-terminal cleavage/methylation domain-containing protein